MRFHSVAALIFAVCFCCFGLTPQGSKKAGADKKTNTQIAIQVTASHSLVKLPPSPDLLPLNCEPTEDKVRLYANATSTHKAAIDFTWQVPVGRLIEKGREVTWNLSGVETGTYTATVEARDQHKHSATGSISVTVVVCPGWRPDPPPCPLVMVSCPIGADENRSLTFVATVAGANPETKPTYKWSVSVGKIISGQATSKVIVDISGLKQPSVTATVSVGGFDPGCATVASCTIHHP